MSPDGCADWEQLAKPRTVDVPCGDEEHTIRWERGCLRRIDHDLEAEAAASALGADPPWCLDLVEAWPWADLEVEMLDILSGWGGGGPARLTRREIRNRMREAKAGFSGGGKQLGLTKLTPDVRAAMQERVLDRLREAYRMVLLQDLPPLLKAILAAKLAADCDERWRTDEGFRKVYGRRIESMVSLQATPLLHASLEGVGRRVGPRTTISCWLCLPGEGPSISAWEVNTGAGAAVTLPLHWLPRVWARGIALVDGCFVLDVLRDDGDRVEALGMRWEFAARTARPVVGRVNLTREDGSWSPAWA